MESNYWSKTLSGRINRRRLIAASGASALGAAFLAACGGGDDGESSGSSDKTSLIIEDGGLQVTGQERAASSRTAPTADAPSFNVQEPIAPLNNPAKHVYSTLVRQKAPYLQEPQTARAEPGLRRVLGSRRPTA